MTKTEKKFISKLNKVTKEIEREIVDDFSDKMTKTYVSAIEKFYNDYDPWYYDRTYSLYRGFSGFYHKIRHRFTDGSYAGGIIVGSEYIGNNPYHQDVDYVFNRAFTYGIHGIAKSDPKRKKEEKEIDSITALARELAGLSPYTPTYAKREHIPNKMKPTPKKIVDKEFKKLTNKENIRKIFNNKFSHKFSLYL